MNVSFEPVTHKFADILPGAVFRFPKDPKNAVYMAIEGLQGVNLQTGCVFPFKSDDAVVVYEHVELRIYHHE